MRKRSLILSFYLLAALALGLFSMQCHTESKKEEATSGPQFLNLGDSAQYVGMSTCRKCHEDIYESFVQTGMGKSFGLATQAKSAGNFHHNKPIYDKYSDLYYQPYWQDTSLMVKEYRLNGKDTIHKRIERVDYIVGSGHHTNSHIVNQNGYLYQAPFTFFVQQATWDMPPGFENGNNTRFSRALGLECLSCHNGYPKFVQGSFNKYTMVPHGIDCERCHGPGSIHVRTKLEGKAVDISKQTDYTIVNPKKLPYPLQIDVCQRCHLQGDAVLKPGKTWFDFRPGMPLSNVMDVFMPVFQNQEKGFLMAAHAERLQKSRCFLESQDIKNPVRMNCITCHNPHVSVKFTPEQYFISKCTACHTKPHESDPQVLQTKGQNCITCHMPKSSPVDIPHVTITDHYIRVVKQNESKDNAAIGHGKFLGLHCVNNPKTDNLTHAKGYLYFYEKFQHEQYVLDSAKKYMDKFTAQDQPALFIYYDYLKNDFEGVTRVASAYGSNITEPVVNYEIGQSYMNQGNMQSALTYIKKAVDEQPFNLDYRLKLGTVYTYLRDFNNATQQFNFVTNENSKLASGWNGLAFLDLVSGDLTKARMNLDKSLALDPDLAAARLNLAKWYLAQNNIPEARKQVEMVLKRDARNQDALQLLALLNQNRP
jgi:hypothetical protein